jgi:hypothetical protein
MIHHIHGFDQLKTFGSGKDIHRRRFSYSTKIVIELIPLVVIIEKEWIKDKGYDCDAKKNSFRRTDGSRQGSP